MLKKIIKKPFGVLRNVVIEANGNLKITNNQGDSVIMAASKWSSQIPAVQQKCKACKGKNVQILTSQTTSSWSQAEYFCDIEAM